MEFSINKAVNNENSHYGPLISASNCKVKHFKILGFMKCVLQKNSLYDRLPMFLLSVRDYGFEIIVKTHI